MTNGKLNFDTPMINFSNGKELLNATSEELESLDIVQPLRPSSQEGIPEYQKLYIEYEKQLEENRDSLSKYTCGDAMNQLLDVLVLTSKSNIASYSEILKDIKIAKKNLQNTVEVTADDLEKLKKIFSEPPKDPTHNRRVIFVHECLVQCYVDMKTPPVVDLATPPEESD